MAITVTVNSVNITAYVPMTPQFGLPGLRVEQDGIGEIGRCTFGIYDDAAVVSISTKHSVVIADGGTTLFKGYVADIKMEQLAANIKKYVVACQDLNVRLEEQVIISTTFSATADSDIVGTLMSHADFMNGEFNGTTYVNTIVDPVTISFLYCTVREAMTQLCQLTGGMFYVDYAGNMHYFASSEGASAPFDLSDSPNFSSTFPYGNFRKVEDGTYIVDRVYVHGPFFGDWIGSGNYEGYCVDDSLDTEAAITARGNAIIAQYGTAQERYELVCWQDGLAVGDDIDVTNALWGLSAETLTIRKLRMTCISTDGTDREYHLELGDRFRESPGGGGGAVPGSGAIDFHELLSLVHTDTAETAVTRGDIIAGVDNDSVVEWDAINVGAAYTHLESDGTDIAWQANLTMADDTWIGRGAAAGRLVFDSTPSPDQLEITAADLNFVTTAHGIIHVDGVTDGLVLRANGTRFVPGSIAVGDLPAHNLLSATHGDTTAQTVSRGSLVCGMGEGPTWNELTIGAAWRHLESDGTDVSWLADLTMADNSHIGLPSGGGRLVFDNTPSPDQLEVHAESRPTRSDRR